MAEVLNQEQVLVNEDTLTTMADSIRLKLGEETNPNAVGFTKYTPMELANKIANEMPLAKDAIPNSAKHLTGNCNSLFVLGNWDWFIEQCGEEITTEGITYTERMFERSKVKSIPFDLNCAYDCIASHTFYNCENLEHLPNITGRLINFFSFLDSCKRIREIPEQWATGIDWDYINTNTDFNSCRISSFFTGCYSLRSIPKVFIKRFYGASSNFNASNGIFNACVSLEEIEGFRGSNTTLTSNCLNGNFNYCSRLTRLVFDYEDEATNTPRTQNWKGQTIDLSYGAGYVKYGYMRDYILNYNSGIIADKEVKDDATYQALKNDPDWFTSKVEYSRYNHDSAVETINSLPDTSAYLAANGGTNTIKFEGAAGSATDGGAINTLTEAEIAVAAAKGWTVSLV